MTPLRRLAAVACSVLVFPVVALSAESPGLWWAYGEVTPPKPGDKSTLVAPAPVGLRDDLDVAEQTRPRSVPGAARTHTLVEIRNRLNVVDWFPGDHPPMPDVVRVGPVALGQNSYGCALCHMPHGKGRPENAPINALPVAYFLRQLEDFRSGARTSGDPRKANTLRMIELARAMTPVEMRAAAEYYGAMPATPWIRVVETDLVPKTRISASHYFIATETARTEPIAGRIIEAPEDLEQFENANPRSGLVAYVPTGSIRRGQDLAQTGGATIVDGKVVAGKTIACVTCHGPDLRGLATMPDVPSLAGRSPSYLARQLYDFRQGSRHGLMAPMMQPVVVNLTDDDITALVAYVSSLPPGAAGASQVATH